MTKLEEYLLGVIRRVQRNFPETGIVILTVTNPDDQEEGADLMFQSNMAREETIRVMRCMADPEELEVVSAGGDAPTSIH